MNGYVSKAWLALLITLVMSAHAQPAASEMEPLSWSGEATFTTETFEAAGTWEVTLGAWCFEGVGFVRVVAFDADAQEVGRTIVIGEGVESAVLLTEPGEYYLEVTVSHMHTYNWEVLVASADPEAAGSSSDATGDGTGGAAAELPQSWMGEEAFTSDPFRANGEWRITLGAWSDTEASFVVVVAYDEEGREAGRVTVSGQGVEGAVLVTPPGTYYLEVTSPDMDAYRWELVVQPVREV